MALLPVNLTVKLRGRAEALDQSRGRTMSSRARGDTTEHHGPLQRLLDGHIDSLTFHVRARAVGTSIDACPPPHTVGTSRRPATRAAEYVPPGQNLSNVADKNYHSGG